MSDNPDKKDMTRIEDLSEFLHNDDPEVDRLLEGEDDSFSEEDTEVSEMNAFPYASPEDENEPTAAAGLDELEDLPDLPSESEPADDEGEADLSASSEAEFSDDPFADNPFASEIQEEDEDTGHNPFASELDSDPFAETDTEDDEDAQESNFDFAPETEEETKEETEDESDELEGFEPTDSEVIEEEEAQADEDSDSPSESFFDPTPETSTADSYTPPPQTPVTTFAKRENFEDLKKFASSLSYGDVSSPGNPPFSLVLKDIKYQEDADDILAILREHKLVSAENEKDYETGLSQGALLIGQLSEYSAIYLAHRLRRFDLDIAIGLADEIHPSKNYEREGRGLITKDQLYQNKRHTHNFERTTIHPNDVIVATTSTLEGYKVERYIDVVTEHIIISEAEMRAAASQGSAHSDEDQSTSYQLGLSEVYQSLMNELRPKAFKLGGNAVLGINFSLTPIAGSEDYKITCAGNVAWINNGQ